MADVSLRTRRLHSKYKFAFFIRVFMFFAIPSLYFVSTFYFGAHFDESDEFNQVATSRHLLSIPESLGNCTPAAILEFPSDGFTRLQRQHGFIALHCLLAIYCFLLLGTVCEQYFVPAIGFICDRLDMPADVAGATFMATASSSPELFINCVGTFVTEGDLGVGAVVGSAVFNVLAVPACCSFVASKAVELDWWSVSRDCMMYAAAVVALILTLLDDRVDWHEAALLVLMYSFYILAMVFNNSLSNFMRSSCCVPKKKKLYTEITPLLIKDKSIPLDTHKANGHTRHSDLENGDLEASKKINPTPVENNNSGEEHQSLESSSVLEWPGEESLFRRCLWVLSWPVSLLLWATIPDCRNRKKLYPLTFIMCILWIGGVSYLVAWIITIIGDTLNVPDSITGLTVLAAGTSLPEAVSSVLVTMQGHGAMGISNSIGSNTFDILLCLGLPWLIKSLFYPAVPGNHSVMINSSGLSYSAISLLSTLFALYGSLMLNSFRLDWRIGVTCLVFYVGFLAMASIIELNVLFVVNKPICPH